MTIRLMGDDTYTLEFRRVWGIKINEIKKVKGVYAEDLKGIFEQETGLFLSFR